MVGLLLLGACALREGPIGPGDAGLRLGFEERCARPGVVKCFGFDSADATDRFVFPPHGLSVKRGRVVTDVKASGAGSLRFEIPSSSGADTSGSFWQNFADDRSVQFGQGEEFYVQWRQRFSPELLRTRYQGGGGWKQAIIGEGDRPGKTAYSCTQLEIVVQNGYHRGYPQMYHSCGGKDGQYQGLPEAKWVSYRADQWMTFQVRVKIGTWYRNDRRYHRDSAIELWVAEEGAASRLAVSHTRYDIANTDPEARYGKVWLLPYNTGKSPAHSHPIAYTWYDELVISRFRIADPAGSR